MGDLDREAIGELHCCGWLWIPARSTLIVLLDHACDDGGAVCGDCGDVASYAASRLVPARDREEC